MNDTTSKPSVTWQADQSYPELCKKLRDSLRDVKDPEIGLDVIQLGLIRDVEISDKEANLKMILTTPFCPYAPVIIEMTQKKAQEALTRPTKVTLGTEVWDMSMMEDGLGDDWGLLF